MFMDEPQFSAADFPRSVRQLTQNPDQNIAARHPATDTSTRQLREGLGQALDVSVGWPIKKASR
jgi:hypothetical protein